ncbi:hypothetical protein [Streptomyces sp. Da 82-17]|uniref:hypothetical protein n=1 Tax=Streptomyces sp. Da 82-17 TaxID=3377116 RepID=UPI0038D4CD98
MDIENLMSPEGMRAFTDEQRDTLTTDASQVRQLALIIKARIAQTQIDGDKPWSAKLRAYKVGKQFEQVAKQLEKAAAGCEGINASYKKDVLEVPARRERALERKEQRAEQKMLAKARAKHGITGALAENAHALNAGTGAANPQVNAPAAPPAPQYVNPAPFPMPQAPAQSSSGQISDHFPDISLEAS